MNVDEVAVAAIVVVVLCLVIVGYIGVKIKQQIDKDAKAHKE
ncbi:MAG: hypothetical protein OQK42_00670 [Sedimenticola sp.]|nr:hypothetical protein [Sedimenticola sp.]MCW8881770.1 hypothetical protein [Sedimenticola sp.]MCW8920522.1 hypothetical protein [Sedimenticola sp.]MCW8946101.1 hypothetical protein [Sedimenticola sp.]MCW8950614.1 hypothetical protein [Sedimenticola sp.]